MGMFNGSHILCNQPSLSLHIRLHVSVVWCVQIITCHADICGRIFGTTINPSSSKTTNHQVFLDPSMSQETGPQEDGACCPQAEVESSSFRTSILCPRYYCKFYKLWE